MNAERVDPAPSGGARRTLGFAAGAMLVAGAVVASTFGFNNGSDTTPTAGAGEPVGALPSKGAPGGGPVAAPAAPAAAPDAEQVTSPAAEETAPEGEIGRAASVKPPAKAAPAAPIAPAPPKPPAAPPAQAAPAPGPVQGLTEPVTDTVGGGTLTKVVAPVTNTVDDTLTPALSLIGGLLGR